MLSSDRLDCSHELCEKFCGENFRLAYYCILFPTKKKGERFFSNYQEWWFSKKICSGSYSANIMQAQPHFQNIVKVENMSIFSASQCKRTNAAVSLLEHYLNTKMCSYIVGLFISYAILGRVQSVSESQHFSIKSYAELYKNNFYVQQSLFLTKHSC